MTEGAPRLDPSRAPISAPILKIVTAVVIQGFALARTVDQIIQNVARKPTLPVSVTPIESFSESHSAFPSMPRYGPP